MFWHFFVCKILRNFCFPKINCQEKANKKSKTKKMQQNKKIKKGKRRENDLLVFGVGEEEGKDLV